MRAFVPIDSEPLESLIDRGRGFLGVAFRVGVLNSENQFAAVMVNEKPIKQSGPRAADVEITGRRWSESDSNIGSHFQTTVIDRR